MQKNKKIWLQQIQICLTYMLCLVSDQANLQHIIKNIFLFKYFKCTTCDMN